MSKYLVVVIPGIGGSELVDERGRKVWAMSPGELGRALVEPGRLSLDNRLTPVGLTGDLAVGPWSLIPGYGRLVRELMGALRLGPAGQAVARPGRRDNPHAHLLCFPYDFRRSISASAEQLAEELRWRLGEGRRVIVVAHSMGGLVAAWWWAMLGGHEVTERIFTLGTPFLGAAKAIDTLLYGPRIGLGRNAAAAEVLRGWESPFELLPKNKAVEDGEADVRVHDLAVGYDGFRGAAACAYERHRELLDEVQRLTADPAKRLVWAANYSRGHSTPSRVVLAGGELRVEKSDPRWLAGELAGLGQGDGTVPMYSAIPPWLHEQRGQWDRRSAKHVGLSYVEEVVTKVRDYALPDFPAQTRGDEAHRAEPFILLDHDDVVPAGEPVRLGIGLDAPERGEAAPRVSLGARRLETWRAGDGWVAEVPGLPAGVHTLRVQFDHVPGRDRLRLDTTIGAIDA